MHFCPVLFVFRDAMDSDKHSCQPVQAHTTFVYFRCHFINAPSCGSLFSSVASGLIYKTLGGLIFG